MSAESTREVIERYFAGHDVDVLAEDAVFINMDTGERYEGRDAVNGMLAEVYDVGFDAEVGVRKLTVADGTVLGEFSFKGTHKGEFAGIAATGRTVEYDFAVAYEVRDGQVTEGRMYVPTTRLLGMLTD